MRISVWMVIGVFTLALVIGLLTGLSSSPVVGILLPLLFPLVMGVVTLITGRELLKRRPEMRSAITRFLGIVCIVFSLGLIAGLYLGVMGKMRSDAVWFTREKPAYHLVEYTDMGTLAAAMLLDAKMIASGLAFDERIKVFRRFGPAPQGVDKVETIMSVVWPVQKEPPVCAFAPIAVDSGDNPFFSPDLAAPVPAAPAEPSVPASPPTGGGAGP